MKSHLMMRTHGRRTLRRLLRSLFWPRVSHPGPGPDFQHLQAA
jgi:hypothetical protein